MDVLECCALCFFCEKEIWPEEYVCGGELHRGEIVQPFNYCEEFDTEIGFLRKNGTQINYCEEFDTDYDW